MNCGTPVGPSGGGNGLNNGPSQKNTNRDGGGYGYGAQGGYPGGNYGGPQPQPGYYGANYANNIQPPLAPPAPQKKSASGGYKTLVIVLSAVLLLIVAAVAVLLINPPKFGDEGGRAANATQPVYSTPAPYYTQPPFNPTYPPDVTVEPETVPPTAFGNETPAPETAGPETQPPTPIPTYTPAPGMLTQYDFGCTGLDIGHEFMIGLRANGTVVADGDNSWGQCDVGSWRDIVAVAAGYTYSLGLRSDGTVVMAGRDDCIDRNVVQGWRNIIQISAQDSTIAALDSYGQIHVEGVNKKTEERYTIPYSISSRSDVISVSAGRTHVLVLFADHTCAAFGSDEYNMCDVGSWRDVVSICACQSGSVGLTSNGTVLYIGASGHNQMECSGLTNISSIASKGWHFVFIRTDGTVGAVGYRDDDRCNVDAWNYVTGKHPVAVVGSLWNTAVLFSDGTVAVTGHSSVTQKLTNVNHWSGIVRSR